MPQVRPSSKNDHGQGRAVPVRARSQASRDAIVQGALALWRTKGFAETTVTDICKAAGVSKALFYVYFARREDVLMEIEIFTMRDAHLAARAVASHPYELVDLIRAVIDVLERGMRRYPPELVFEAVLETYRLEQRALADGDAEGGLTFLFREPFEQARRDGRLPPDTDIERTARLSQILVGEGIRSWTARQCEQPLAQPLAQEISTLIGGAPAR
ncbi:TetR/AcrR family transcriptional regulator [Actinomadura sp. GTD37]|uniref:TetR/AcrR family transcriptional regulator n=1 Tax=Actinomadura sp. GTD37 TaxID=1778030 RepID=UPI0035BF9491